MKLSRNMAWAEPFVSAVSDLVPLSRVHLKGFSVPLHLHQSHVGRCIDYRTHYSITVRLTDRDTKLKRNDPQILEDALVVLAHELAHTVHMDHSPEHFKLTARILGRFANVLKKLGIQDTSRRLIRRKEAA